MTSSSAIKLYICMTMRAATLRLWRRLYSAAAPHAPADPIEDRSSRYCSCSLENHGDALRASVHDTNHFSCFSSQVPAYWQAVNKTMNHVTLRFKRSFSFFYMSRWARSVWCWSYSYTNNQIKADKFKIPTCNMHCIFTNLWVMSNRLKHILLKSY